MKKNIKTIIMIGLVFCFIAGTVLGAYRGQWNFKDGDVVFVKSSSSGTVNIFNATTAGVQAAANSLNNLTGWIDCNKINITLTTTLWLGTNCELRNFHFYLGTNADKTMIRNYSNAGNGIYIHDGYLNGNGINQPHQNSSFKMYNQPCGIWVYGGNITIRDVTIYNTQFAGCTISTSKNGIIDNVRVYKAGWHHENVAYTPGDCYSAWGIFLWNTSESIISNCIVNRTWSCGIGIESTLPSINQYRCQNSRIENCLVMNTTIGYYFEDATNITIIDCDAKNGKLKNTAYSISHALHIHANTCDHIKVIGCTFKTWKDGIRCGGDNITIDNCELLSISRYAFDFWGNDSIITKCHIIRAGTYAMVFRGCHWNIVSNNYIYGIGSWGGDAILLSTGCTNFTFSGNIIKQSAISYPDYGIRESSSASNYNRIDSSNIFKITTNPVSLLGSNSWAMWINGSTAKVGIENKTRIYWMNTP